jgi:hypothetical protein
VFDISSEDKYPYCVDYMDQTNCTDQNRVGGHCLIKGYMSTISKYITCSSSSKLETHKPVSLCDDNLENECNLSPGSTDCVIHKHQLCDGVNDCGDFSDEVNDDCSLMTGENFRCNRTFNIKKYMKIPISWLNDEQTDCIDGKDEVIGHLRDCGEGDSRRSVFGKNHCPEVFYCPGDRTDELFVEFDALCDGVDSCDGEAENNACKISRDFPAIQTSAADRDNNCTVRDLCESLAPPDNEDCRNVDY